MEHTYIANSPLGGIIPNESRARSGSAHRADIDDRGLFRRILFENRYQALRSMKDTSNVDVEAAVVFLFCHV